MLDPVGQCLTVTTARRILDLRADRIAQARLEELAEKSNEGTAEDRVELRKLLLKQGLQAFKAQIDALLAAQGAEGSKIP